MQMQHVLLPHAGLIAPSGMDGHGLPAPTRCLTGIAATSFLHCYHCTFIIAARWESNNNSDFQFAFG